jgi:hypothetical protein
MNPASDEAGSDTSGSDTVGTGNDARLALLNGINDANDAVHAEDLADINDDGTTSPFAAPTEDTEATSLTDDEASSVTEEAQAEEAAAPAQMITRKINGKDVTKSLEDWLVTASKVEAADEYIQEAAALRKTAKKEATEPEQQSTQPTAEELAAAQRARRLKQARAIQMGTEEEAVAAIAELEQSARPSLTVDDIGRITDERLTFKEAVSWFQSSYKDLVADPVLHQMVLDRDNALLAAGDKRAYQVRYKEVGDEVREWKNGLIKAATGELEGTPKPAAKTVTTLEEKRAAKAAAPRVPTAANAKAATGEQEEAEETASDIISGIAKARGGPQWARA